MCRQNGDRDTFQPGQRIPQCSDAIDFNFHPCASGQRQIVPGTIPVPVSKNTPLRKLLSRAARKSNPQTCGHLLDAGLTGTAGRALHGQ
jgi:hypothetical protein